MLREFLEVLICSRFSTLLEILPNASQEGSLEPLLTPFSEMQGRIRQIIFKHIKIFYVQSKRASILLKSGKIEVGKYFLLYSLKNHKGKLVFKRGEKGRDRWDLYKCHFLLLNFWLISVITSPIPKRGNNVPQNNTAITSKHLEFPLRSTISFAYVTETRSKNNTLVCKVTFFVS